jgi:hypothetical protein
MAGKRKPIAVPPGIHPLVKLLYEEMNRRGITHRDMNALAGLGEATRNWHRCNPNVVTLAAALGAVGFELKAVPVEKRSTRGHQGEGVQGLTNQ